MQLSPEDRADERALDRLFVRSDSGNMLPLSQFIALTREYMPQQLNGFNMVSSIDISGDAAPGFSSGDAIRAVRETAAHSLPRGYAIEFDGLSREESEAEGNILYILGICLFFAWLVMAALYESLWIPLAILLSVPFGLCGAFLFARIFGVENNIYLQVGLIMLVGLLAKTAILLTEYAQSCRRAGMPPAAAALFAARTRLRPILMTALTMIFGMMPLMFASGTGSNGRRTIGAGTVGGMLVGTLALIFILPSLFVLFQKLQEYFKPVEIRPSDDPLIVAEMGKNRDVSAE